MCTDFEKRIYNEYLKELRRSKNQPYKLRKNFDKIDEKTKLCLKKLSLFFINNKEVSPNDFFKSPYSVYPQGEHFGLDFYTTQRAIKAYKIFIKNEQPVDKTENSDNMNGNGTKATLN